ncbi:DNA-binding transcriptional LysR family regulator [Variovorax paradoxus]|uniref:LysR family transcriptional regulator n=1 Tax=Variovorax paradoxus TaxID=34073 RepID=UPI00278A06CD|nr:LysR family transcriptional regulator [Variovorax paradoxus]MDP9962883.1 DNA-binding transcriptional LysR family regulator [Variovorax paradoxus]
MEQSASVLVNRLLARGKFRHLQVLLKLAELGSVQRAADAVGTTQSSVTQMLAYLERLLEIRLFDRHARGVRPTPACADLLPVARQVLQGITEGAEIVAARHNAGQGSIRLVASAAAINGLLAEAVPAFSERWPGVRVHLREAENDDQLLAIARGEADLVVCRHRAIVPEGWRFQALMPDRFAVVSSPRHRLAGARRVSWKALGGETWLLAPAGSLARERFDALAQRFPQSPKTHPLVTRSDSMMTWLLRRDELIALLPLSFVRPHLRQRDLVEISVDSGEAMEPLGLLQPMGGVGEASVRLAEFLNGFFEDRASGTIVHQRKTRRT